MSCAQVTHRIEPDLRRPSDHAPLLVDLPIAPENICVRRMVLKRDSEEEAAFLLSVSEAVGAWLRMALVTLAHNVTDWPK